MINIKFKKTCNYMGKKYQAGDILDKKDIKTNQLESIWKLNEIGYIYPLNSKEFIKFHDEMNNKKEIKEEVK